MRRRSRSLIPPQMPNFSPLAKRELEAVLAHDAAAADLLGLPGRRSPLREEEVGIDAQAVGVVLPAVLLGIGRCRGSARFPSSESGRLWDDGQYHMCNYNGVILTRIGARRKGAATKSPMDSGLAARRRGGRSHAHDGRRHRQRGQLVVARRRWRRRGHPSRRGSRLARRVPPPRRLRDRRRQGHELATSSRPAG